MDGSILSVPVPFLALVPFHHLHSHRSYQKDPISKIVLSQLWQFGCDGMSIHWEIYFCLPLMLILIQLPILGMVPVRRSVRKWSRTMLRMALMALMQSMTRMDLAGGGRQVIRDDVVPPSSSLALVLAPRLAYQTAWLNPSTFVLYPSVHPHHFLDPSIRAHMAMPLDCKIAFEQKLAQKEVYPIEDEDRAYLR